MPPRQSLPRIEVLGPTSVPRHDKAPPAGKIRGISRIVAASPPRGDTAGDGDGRPKRRVAVLICHGMGQQVPFENLDLIATALADRDSRSHPPAAEPLPGTVKEGRTDRVGFVQIGRQWLPRAELVLSPKGKEPTEVHVYEAYWAPLTEGRVAALDVTRFLFDAGFRGIAHSLGGAFDRWIFGKRRRLPISRWALAQLVFTFAVVVGALALYGVLGLVSALKVAGALFGASAAAGPAAAMLGDLLRSPLALAVALPPLLAGRWLLRTLGALVGRHAGLLAGCAAAMLAAVELWGAYAGNLLARSVRTTWLAEPFGSAPGLGETGEWIWRGSLCAVGLAAVLMAWTGSRSKWVRKAAARLITGMALVLALLVAGSGGMALWRVAAWAAGFPPSSPQAPLHSAFVAYFLLAAALMCYKLRSVYIQYLGDVAVYLSSHQLNEFDEIRSRIRKVGHEVGCAIYEAAGTRAGRKFEYDEVVVAGHSLGSVVAYDTLNGVLNEDRARMGALEVERRTRMLLTFGSPLDKAAFVFRTQVEKADFREALSAAVQPLVEPGVRDGSPRGREIPWVNIYSPADPVSGRVDFYDPPPCAAPAGHLPVRNQKDRDAFIFGQAHVTYWNNNLLKAWLYRAVTTPRRDRAAGVGSPPGPGSEAQQG